jgi:hypothetical protein
MLLGMSKKPKQSHAAVVARSSTLAQKIQSFTLEIMVYM